MATTSLNRTKEASLVVGVPKREAMGGRLGRPSQPLPTKGCGVRQSMASPATQMKSWRPLANGDPPMSRFACNTKLECGQRYSSYHSLAAISRMAVRALVLQLDLQKAGAASVV